MSSIFSSYGIAVSGMKVSQTALTVTSHNLSNISTSGYSRQQISMAEIDTRTSAETSRGCGSSVAEIRRARSEFIDQTYRQQQAKAGYWEAKDANFEDMQLTLNDFTSDSGLYATTEDFFNSWDELAKDPTSLSTRQSVLENAHALVEVVSEIDRQLLQLQQDSLNKVKAGVEQLNLLSGKVTDLNLAIMKAEASGSEACDMRDQRDSIVDQMAKLADIKTQEQSNGMMTVNLNGVSLVSGINHRTLEATGEGSAENPLQVKWADLGFEAVITSGNLRAYLDDADQSSINPVSETELPYHFDVTSQSSIGTLRQALNGWITTLGLRINELHQSGRGLEGATGMDFFVPAVAAKPFAISNFAVNPALEDTDLIAAGSSGNLGDNTVALAIGALLNENNFVNESLAMDGSAFYQNLVSWMGTAGNNANGYYEAQATLVEQVESRRQGLSAVSIDEEMTKMVAYQNAYNASARVLSVIDGLVEGLISEIG